MHVSVFACVCVYMHVCVHACVCICIYACLRVGALTPAHRYGEETGEVVLPVVAGGDDDPLLHTVVLDVADAGAHVETPWKKRQHHDYDAIQ